MKPITFASLLFFISLSISAQNLQRATIGSSGSSTEISNGNDTYFISQSIGQSSVIGTLINGKNTIRQGYQQPPVKVEIISDSNSDIQAVIFPNPVNTYVTVAFNETITNPIQVVMLDIAGKMILNTIQGPTTSFRIDMTLFSSGTYLLRLTSGNRKYIARLIKK